MNRLEELWKSADDGASTPFGPLEIRSEAEFEELLDAWYVERGKSIECEILLDQSKELIRRMLAESRGSPAIHKKARQLIRAIDRTLLMLNERDE